MKVLYFYSEKRIARTEPKAFVSTSVIGRIAELDGLRGIAILLVVSFHYLNNQLYGTSNRIGSMFEKATQFGWLGVDLFFILSGFLKAILVIDSER